MFNYCLPLLTGALLLPPEEPPKEPPLLLGLENEGLLYELLPELKPDDDDLPLYLLLLLLLPDENELERPL